MDNSDIISNFEHSLKKYNAKQLPALYITKPEDPFNQNNEEFKPLHILKNISSQIKAIQSADCIIKRSSINKLANQNKTSNFVPVNLLTRNEEPRPSTSSNKFETQYVTDTQLINIIEDAEAMIEVHSGVTQEFETTFHQMGKELHEDHNKGKETKTVEHIDTRIDVLKSHGSPITYCQEEVVHITGCTKKKSDGYRSIKSIGEESGSTMSHNSESLLNNKQDIMISSFSKYNIYPKLNSIKSPEPDKGEEIPLSPIFNVNQKSNTVKCSPHLTCNLEIFEKFEALAVPVIEYNIDIKAARRMINSQIMNRELSIQIQPHNEDKTKSPILSIDKLKLNNMKLENCDIDYPDEISNSGPPIKMIIEDDILFSSDEEVTDVQEIPLTCALETSFYKQDVLDETMYVGFQTASNKSIQISSDSFCKAQNIFNDVNEIDSTNKSRNLTLTDLVKVYDSTSKQYVFKKTVPKTLDCEINNQLLVSNKSVNISKQASYKNEKIFEAMDGLNEGKSEVALNIHVENKTINDKYKSDTITVHNNQVSPDVKDIAIINEDSILEEMNIDHNVISEFENNVMFSNETPSEIFKLNNNEDNITTQNVQNFESKDKLIDNNKDISEKSLEITSIGNYVSQMPKPVIGFKTATNKNIKISEQAFSRMRNVFQDIDISSCNDEFAEKEITNVALKSNAKPDQLNPTLVAFIGFKTANNKPIQISEKALSKTKTVFKDIDKDDLLLKNNTPTIGQSQIKTEHLNKEIFGFIPKELQYKEKEATVSNSFYLKKEKHNILNLDKLKSNMLCVDQKGFKNASSKPIKISKTALLNSETIISNIQRIENNQDEIYEYKNLEADVYFNEKTCNNDLNSGQFNETSSTIRKTLEVDSDKSNEKLKNNASKESNGLKQNVLHLQRSASLNIVKTMNLNNLEPLSQSVINKKIKMSEDDLNKICNDINPINNKITYKFPKHTNASEIFKGFQTANNKKVKISKDALIKSKKIFEDINLDSVKITDVCSNHTRTKTSGVITGFQMASNKKVKISEDALIKSKKLFEDIGLNDDKTTDMLPEYAETSDAFEGFQTASNKRVKISEDAAIKSKKIFEDIGLNEDKITLKLEAYAKTSNASKGFQTASNKKVKISEDALVRSKKLFDNIGLNEDIITDKLPEYIKTSNAFKGFQTASNKKVKISEDALIKSKKLFGDIGLNEENITDKLPEYVKTSNAFKGFQTASNKKVKISEDALIRSKKLFEDIGFDKDETTINLPESAKTINAFIGFQTASNKRVKISEDALIKSKKILEEIGYNEDDTKNKLPDHMCTSYAFQGFHTASKSEDALMNTSQIFKNISSTSRNDTFENHRSKKPNQPFSFTTANNNQIEISEDALRISKQLLTNKDDQGKIISRKNGDFGSKLDVEINAQSMINTEIMDQFEETLYTEDFLKDRTLKNRRSGSPIFTCPRAKKKKVETPIVKEKRADSSGTGLKYTFDEHYKKDKKFRLNYVKEMENRLSSKKEIDLYILNFTFDTFLNFEFKCERNDVSNNKWTTDDIKKCFTVSANKKLIPDGWVGNHMKLIIWKLIAYEINFPNAFKGVCTVKNVLEQLKYRYHRELYKVERPALRKILEKDEVSNRRIVLRVLSVHINGVQVESVTGDAQNVELLLTDGWYCVMGSLDRMLATLVGEKKIVVGTKLVTQGAELLNCEQGISPLEDTSLVRLKLFGNSTRRAHWDARLGFHGNGAILSRLTDVKPEGGKVSRLRVLVSRVYPMLYVEKFEDGSTVTRSERLERVHQMKYESERQVLLEKIYDEVEKEFTDQESQDSSGLNPERRNLDSGSQIWRAMERNRDPMEYQANLTESQLKKLQDYTTKRRETTLEELRVKVQDRLKKLGLNVARNVVTLLKVRVADVDNMKVSKAMVTVWRPSESLLEIIKEGAWIDLYNVVPTAVRYSELQISAGRQTIFQKATIQKDEKIIITQSLARKCYSLKELVKNPFMTTEYNEIDTVGFIFLVDPPAKEFESTKQLFQNVYLTDADKNIICVNFWGGIKKFGFESLLDTGQVIACVNLQKRSGNTKKNLLQYRATEFSYFTKTSKIDSVRKMAGELSQKLLTLDRRKFIEDCIYLRNNFGCSKYSNTENISPYRFNNYNLSKSKIFIDSPINKDANLNLTGLDFESTFKQTDTQDISPERLKRKKIVEGKIAKLKMYGEPPALSHIHLINKCQNAIRPYKSPLNSNVNVASKEKSPILCGNTNSSMANSKKCLKSMNPVKLNFSNAIDENISKDDPFAEEFDGSPPLSLD